MVTTNNTRINSQKLFCTPEEVISEHPLSENGQKVVNNARNDIDSILDKKDNRKIIIVGPCSIHDTKAAMEYAEKLKTLADKVSDVFLIIMRVYFEKPRTTTGWKGLINDPYLNDSFAIDDGIKLARKLMIEINQMGLPVSTEALDPIMPQYLTDLVAWSAIGARTTESQTHREMASGLSSPVGIKNATDGSLKVAFNALQAIREPHAFLGITPTGQCAITQTTGNPYGHIVLRGGKEPNYDSVHIKQCENELTKTGLPNNIMVDCSHGNSHKRPEEQPLVFENCINQITAGNQNIIGMMLESNLNWGNQNISFDKNQLKYGVSITDACIDWDTTESLLLSSADQLRKITLG
ncbi:3-deoxy-7-phosphoheptulonate synthase [Francisellaceae bacterium]|nr:3-deoxy-7-phosphoheptulonate synthase [Francisellaceae bacterium]